MWGRRVLPEQNGAATLLDFYLLGGVTMVKEIAFFTPVLSLKMLVS